jgi:hypothetical protein
MVGVLSAQFNRAYAKSFQRERARSTANSTAFPSSGMEPPQRGETKVAPWK